MTTYLPSGAPGSDVVKCVDLNLRETRLPSGFRAPATWACHWSVVTLLLKKLAAWSQLSEYLPASTSASHVCAAVTASRSSGLCDSGSLLLQPIGAIVATDSASHTVLRSVRIAFMRAPSSR